MVGDPVLPKSDQTFYQANTASVAPVPYTTCEAVNAPRSAGNAPKYSSADPITAGIRRCLRTSFTESFAASSAEFYNVFNHTNFNGVDTAAFNAAGAQTNLTFGWPTPRTPRRVQLASA